MSKHDFSPAQLRKLKLALISVVLVNNATIIAAYLVFSRIDDYHGTGLFFNSIILGAIGVFIPIIFLIRPRKAGNRKP